MKERTNNSLITRTKNILFLCILCLYISCSDDAEDSYADTDSEIENTDNSDNTDSTSDYSGPTLLPSSSNFNQRIVWEKVYTDGSAGKVNRGVVDSEGNAAVVFMPENESRIHKVSGTDGTLLWSKTISNTVGFGIAEFKENNRVDYIVSGGSGSTQERWAARLNGNTGAVIWNKTYDNDNTTGVDGIRMITVGTDGYLYAAGFIGADEANTIFVVHGGKALLQKIDPSNGNEIWTHTNNATDYALAVVQASDEMLYYASARYESNATLTQVGTDGIENWTKSLDNTAAIILADLTIADDDTLYLGGHAGRETDGEAFDYSCVKIDTNGNIAWIKHYANPRGYSMSYIRNELYGIDVDADGIYLFGGSGDESESYSQRFSPYLSSDVWNGWVLAIDTDGDILKSDLYCHEDVNTATEYGCLTEDAFFIFNDTDAYGDTEVGIMKVLK